MQNYKRLTISLPDIHVVGIYLSCLPLPPQTSISQSMRRALGSRPQQLLDLLLYPLIETVLRKTVNPAWTLLLLLLEDSTNHIDPLPPRSHKLAQLLRHLQQVVLIWPQSRRRRPSTRRCSCAIRTTVGCAIDVGRRTFLLLVLRSLGALFLLQFGVERADVLVNGVAEVDVFLVAYSIASDGCEAGFAGLVRGYDCSELLLSLTKSGGYGIVKRVREIRLSKHRVSMRFV